LEAWYADVAQISPEAYRFAQDDYY
jgi:hypothetical protein